MDYQDITCKGVVPLFLCPHPQNKKRQPEYRNEEIKAKIKAKLEKAMKKGYIEIADIQLVESIMYIFDVVKGDDICMVYGSSKSGLNDALWAQWFSLPTIYTMTQWTFTCTWL